MTKTLEEQIAEAHEDIASRRKAPRGPCPPPPNARVPLRRVRALAPGGVHYGAARTVADLVRRTP